MSVRHQVVMDQSDYDAILEHNRQLKMEGDKFREALILGANASATMRDESLATQENLRAARQAHDELNLRLEEAQGIIEEWRPFPTVRVRELESKIQDLEAQIHDLSQELVRTRAAKIRQFYPSVEAKKMLIRKLKSFIAEVAMPVDWPDSNHLGEAERMVMLRARAMSLLEEDA